MAKFFRVPTRMLTFCSVLFLFIFFTAGPASAKDWFYAGASKVDVTPPLQYPMMQGGKGGMSTGLHHNPDYESYPSDPDRLYARVIALSWKGADLILVSLDSAGMLLDDVNFVRNAVKMELGIDTSNLIVSSTHTHNAPDILGPYGEYSPGVCEAVGYCATHYREQLLLPGIIEAVLKAYRSREPATLKVAQIETEGMVFNRRTWTPENRSSGIVDPELTVFQFAKTTDHHDVIATLANFSVHMVPAVGSHEISADASGYLVAKFEREYGGVGLFVPGAIGNHNPAPYFNAADPYPFDATDPNLSYAPYGTIWDDNPGNPYQDPDSAAWDALDPEGKLLRTCWGAVEEYAEKLKNYSIRALDGGKLFKNPTLKVQKRIVTVPLENPAYTMQTLPMDDPTKILARSGVYGGTMAFLASYQVPRTVYADNCGSEPVPFINGACYFLDTEVFLVKMGPVAFATLPGESFVETQLILKSKLPKYGFVVGLAPEELGYIAPTHYIDTFWDEELFEAYGPIPELDYWGSKGPNDYESRLQAVTSGTGVMTQKLLEALIPMIDQVTD